MTDPKKDTIPFHSDRYRLFRSFFVIKHLSFGVQSNKTPLLKGIHKDNGDDEEDNPPPQKWRLQVEQKELMWFYHNVASKTDWQRKSKWRWENVSYFLPKHSCQQSGKVTEGGWRWRVRNTEQWRELENQKISKICNTTLDMKKTVVVFMWQWDEDIPVLLSFHFILVSLGDILLGQTYEKRQLGTH